MTAKKSPKQHEISAKQTARNSPAKRAATAEQPGPDGGTPKVPDEKSVAKLNEGGSPKKVVSHQEQFSDIDPDLSKNPGPAKLKGNDKRFERVHVDREVVSHQEQFADLNPTGYTGEPKSKK